MDFKIILCFIVVQLILLLNFTAFAQKGDEKPMPYKFNWKVSEKDAKPNGAFFDHNEKKDEANLERTEGEYRVWLPDGRLMIVTYYVDGESGFVPTVTFEENHQPEWKN